jgi:phenazine biosynthesis protein phzE
LKERASELSQFYFDDNQNRDLEVPKIKWKKFLLLNNEDDFIFMLGFMIRKMWWETLVKNTLDYVSWDEKNYDVVVLGPWPWDINDETHPIMNKLWDVTEYLINKEQKLLWVCLWHQAICKQKWFEVKRQEEITQWAVKNVSIDGKNYSLGFYNSFSPVVKDWFDWNTFFSDRVLIYSEENIASMQFHPESILSKDGFEVLKNQVLKLFLE